VDIEWLLKFTGRLLEDLRKVAFDRLFCKGNLSYLLVFHIRDLLELQAADELVLGC
jgi:hypothetical protein